MGCVGATTFAERVLTPRSPLCGIVGCGAPSMVQTAKCLLLFFLKIREDMDGTGDCAPVFGHVPRVAYLVRRT